MTNTRTALKPFSQWHITISRWSVKRLDRIHTDSVNARKEVLDGLSYTETEYVIEGGFKVTNTDEWKRANDAILDILLADQRF